MKVPGLGSTAVHPQERFLYRFEPDGHGGFVYRAAPWSPGVSVTAEERARIVAVDDGRRGIATILFVIDLPLTAALNVILTLSPITAPWAQIAAGSIFWSMPVAALVWVSMGPKRILRGHPHVDRGPSQAEVARRATRETPWEYPLLPMVGAVISGIGLFNLAEGNAALRGLGVIIVLFSIAGAVHLMVIGRRIEARQRRARGE